MEEHNERTEKVLPSPQKGVGGNLDGAIPIGAKLTIDNVENEDSLSPLLDNTDKIEGANITFTDGYEHNQSSITNESDKEGDSPICVITEKVKFL